MSEWINVKERLPEIPINGDSEIVLVAQRMSFKPNRLIVKPALLRRETGCFGDAWFWVDLSVNPASVVFGTSMLGVVCWMPLPEPPSEEAPPQEETSE